MSSLRKSSDRRFPLIAWLLTGLGVALIPMGLLLANRVHAAWWTAGLWISAAGSSMILWGLAWLVLVKSALSVQTTRGLATLLAIIVAGFAFAHTASRPPRQTIDLVRILLDTHLVGAGLVLVTLGADIIQTAPPRRRERIVFWLGPFASITAGLFGLGWMLQKLAAWRFPALVAIGALAFLAVYYFRRCDEG